MSTSSPIRVLHVLTAMNRAGAETMLMNIYRVIDREKVQFDFAVTATEKCDYDDEIISLGGRIIHYPKYRGTNHFSYKKWWDDFFCNHDEYRIVHGHIGSTASIYLSIAKKHNCFAIAHCHSVGQMTSFRDFVFKLYSFSTRYIADYFIGCSELALKSRYGRRVCNNHEISTILKNSIDVKRYEYSIEIRNQMKRELGIENEDLVVGTVGRLTVAKNPFFIVDILADLKSVTKSFKFLWVGTGELKEKIEDYIKQKDLEENILLLGVREDVNRILQVLNVFILPSVFEGLPVVGIETQAAGVPFLCSDQVTSEVKISECVKFLPITSTAPWVKAILDETDFRRIPNSTDDVINSGYEVVTESKKLLRIYDMISDKKTNCFVEDYDE